MYRLTKTLSSTSLTCSKFQVQHKMPGGMPPHPIPTQPYSMPRPKMDHMCGNMGSGGPRAYSVMAPNPGPGGVKHPQFYVLSTQRPIQTQPRNVNMAGGKPIMGQNKILVSAGQQPVKMQQSPHIGFMPVCKSKIILKTLSISLTSLEILK